MGICNVDKDFHHQLWYILLPKATISLNLLRQSIIHPHLSAYTHIFGNFDYNHRPLAPPGTIVVIHDSPKDTTSWEPYVEPGWYIGPAMEHYIYPEAYIPKIIAETISHTVDFSPINLTCYKCIIQMLQFILHKI